MSKKFQYGIRNVEQYNRCEGFHNSETSDCSLLGYDTMCHNNSLLIILNQESHTWA
jgi:hypothetical protein